MSVVLFEGDENKIVDVVLSASKPPTVYEVCTKLGASDTEQKDWGQLVHKMVKAKKLTIEKDNTVSVKLTGNDEMDFKEMLKEATQTLGPVTGGVLPSCFDSTHREPAPYPKCYDDAKNPAVHHPSHYTRGGIETIDFIEAKGLNFHLGNVVKYVSRAGFKEDATLQDLEKALWYLNREITRLKGK